MSDLEEMPAGIIVIPPELLEKASAEEKEAYFQYIVEKVVEADDWELWVKTFFPSVAGKPFSRAHREFWEWVWEVERDDRPTPWVSVWPRGFAKSTSTELAVTALAARGKRRYGLYVCHEIGTPILDPDSGEWMFVEEHPSAWERHGDGFEVSLSGFQFPEVVTPEHRYWAKRNDVIGWVEAKDLDESTWVGLPVYSQTRELLGVGERTIEGETAWSRVRSIRPVENRTFIPITTRTSTYITAFGLSHNCETQEQADDHVANVAALLTNPTLELAYPELGEKLLDKHGNSKGWRRNRIRTGAGFTLDAMGLDSAARGVKLEDQRPDFICHEVGTEIIDGDWSGKVEDHPGLLAINEARGLEVNIWGTPDAEVVTQEHKYWAREVRPRRRESHLNTTPGWVEASDLSERHFIGTPINQDVIDPPTVLKYFPGRNISRDEKGRISTSSGEFEQFLPEEFNDPEWWWFFGLWWGDGSNTSRHTVQVTIADHEPHVFERLSALLDRYEMPFFIQPQVGCYSVTLYNTWMSVWLQTWRYELEGQSKAGLKCPPRWVESISHEFQAQLMRGYVDADGYVTSKEVKITSVSELGLQTAKRILARLGVASSIRNLREAGTTEICGVTATTKRAYDLRFGAGAEALDIHLDLTDRYRFGRVFIEDGFLWSKVRQTSDAGWRKFAPIDVGGNHTYLTRFGLSHNCLDDIDGELDTEDRTSKKIKTITRKIIPAGSQDCAVLMVQNLVHENSVFAQLVDGRADFLRDRKVSGPIPAIWNMDYEERDGKFVITGGEPSWPEGFPIASCQLLMNDIGLSAFLAECQHETKPPEGDVFSHINFARCSWDDVPKLKKTVVWVDPAVTSTDSSDSMGIHCDGLGTDGKIYRLWSWENRANPYAAIRLAVTKAIELKADVVGVEVNQGRDLWRGVYDQVCEDIRKEGEDYYRRLPRYKESIATKDLGSKIARAQRMLVDYERGVFVHVEGTHTTLEMALRRFPKVKPYDLVDSSFWAWHEIAGGMHRKKSRVSSAKGRHTRSSI